jgi:hypothetical protein
MSRCRVCGEPWRAYARCTRADCPDGQGWASGAPARHWQVPLEQQSPDDERDPWQPGKAPRAPRRPTSWLRVVQVMVMLAIAFSLLHC